MDVLPHPSGSGAVSRRPGFVQISRSCIVNLSAVLYLGSSNCHMKSGEDLPVSRRARRNVQSQWNDFIFRRMSQAEEVGL